MKKLYTVLLCTLSVAFTFTLHAQCPADPSVTTVNVDLSATTDSVWNITNLSRNGFTCGASNPNVCIRFNVTINPGTKEVAFDVQKPAPPGGAYYQLNCGAQTSLGTPLCVSGMTTFCITFCKSGNDQPTYIIRTTKGFKPSNAIALRAGGSCAGQLSVQGLQTSSITWTSVYPGSTGVYNSYLSCTSGCDTTYVTPAAVAPGTPSYITYKVCGTNFGCSAGNTVCDSVRVYTFPALTVNITPATPAICAGGNSTITMVATPSGGAPPYNYSWSGPGGFTSTQPSITISSGGTYTVSVGDSTICSPVVQSKTVLVSQLPNITSSPTDTICNTTGQTYTITADVAGTTYNWSRPVVAGISNAAAVNQTTSTITEVLTNTTTSPIPVQYIITPTANGCVGATFTYTVTVNPTPVVTSPSTGITCSAVAQTYTITANIGGATFIWSRAAVTGISNAAVTNQTGGIISETLVNTTSTSKAVIYVITPSANGCSGPSFNYTVTVNPTPLVTSASTATICNNTAQNYTIVSNVAGTSFNWSRASVSGISNPAVSNQAGNPITESLTNTTNTPVSVSYLITPSSSGCDGATFTYTVTVNPTPVVTSPSIGSTCSAIAQNYSITSNVVGATFTWSRAAVTGISNPAVSNQSGSTISESLTNTTAASITVTYLITPVANGCSGPVFNYDVSVNPTPTVTSAPSGFVCSGSALNYIITSAVSGATFTWSRAAVTGISNPTISNQAGSSITETLINTTTTAKTVIYVITPSANGCTGPVFNYSVTVNPTPSITSAPAATICNSTAQNYTIASTVAGTTYNWSRATVTGISNTAVTNQSTAIISESLTNTTTAPVNAIYLITPTANGCTGSTFSYTVTVNPTPLVNSAPSEVICDNTALNYSINSNIPGTTFTWSRAAVTGISNAAVSNQTSSTITETLVNFTSTSKTVTYVIVPTVNGCNGPAFNHSVTVNPTPVVTSPSNGSVCNNISQNYTITANVSGTTFSWSRNAITGISNPAVANQTSTSITETLQNTTTSPIDVQYMITPVANGCAGATFTYTVTITPTVTVNSAATGTTCSGVAQDYIITSPVSGTSFTWSRSNVTGISNPAVTNQGGNQIFEALTNTTNSPIVVEYIITPSVSGCSSANFSYKVTVNPTPVVTSAPTGTICSASSINYTINSNVTGATFTWSRAAVTGIQEGAVMNQSGSSITEILTNTTTAPITVTYIITPSANGCDGPVFNYKVTVNPTPSITSSSSATVCNNTAQNYNISANVPGTTFTWSRPAVTGITNSAVNNQAGNTITETLINSTTSPVDVQYYITPIANSCSGGTFTYTVTVNPTPHIISPAVETICTNTALNYTISADVTGTSYTWNRAVVPGISNPALSNQTSGTITETLINTTATAKNVIYIIVPTANGCSGPSFDYTVTVNPAAVISSAATATICNNTAQNYTITSNVSGTTFTWSRDAVAGISNPAVSGQTSSSITETLTNTTNAPVAVTYLITPSANGCDGATFTYTVTIQPTPTVTSGTTATICNSAAQDYMINSDVSGATFTWSRATVTGISNPAVSNQSTNNIKEALTNTTNAPVTVTYVITPAYNGCTGPVFNYNVTINPTPVVNSPSTGTLCSGSAQNYDITSNVSGASFTWSRAAVTSISEPSVSNQSGSSITETLTNTTTSPLTVTYIITPSANDCQGPAFTYKVTVNPTAVITSAASGSTCNGVALNYQLTSTVAGTTFTWSRPAVTGISNPAVNNQSGSLISEKLDNTTTSPVTVQYFIIPSANGCSSATFSYTVTVNPTVLVTSAAAATVCNNTAQNYAITANVSGATFTWSRPSVAGISNAAVSNQTGSTITETLVNTTNAPIVVNYTITPSVTGCASADFSYKVTVNPTPRVTSAATATTCNNTAQNYTITSNVSGTTFTWSRNAAAGISNPAVSGQTSSSITETLTNTTNAPVAVTYLITPSANGCNGPVFSYKVTVNPTPVITSATTAIVCSGSAQNYAITSNVTGITFTWDRVAVPGISNPALTNQTTSNITESLTNTTNGAIAVTYSITSHYNSCDGPVFNYTVTVNPAPVVTSSDSAIICNNTTQNYSIQTNVTDANFTWSRAAVPGISNPAVSNQTSSTITETLVNTVTYPVKVTYVITPAANGCTGSAFKYTVTVNPTTIVTSPTSATVCNNTAQNYTIQSNVAGTSYSWSRAAQTGISNNAVSNQSGGTITETLTNTSASVITVTYVISPTANGCTNPSAFNYIVTVNPTPTVTSSTAASICNNSPQNYSITSSVAGTTYLWNRATVMGIANAPVVNQPNSTITESLNNTSNAPVNVTYVITPYANGCAGPSFNYVVTVNPTPIITCASSGSICNNAPQNYSITSNVIGATFNWSRASVAGISNAAVANQPSNNITETLTNTTNTPVMVTYSITATANGCSGPVFNYQVEVNPTPIITSGDTGVICSGSAQNYSILSNVAGATFTWDRVAVTGISNPAIANQSSSFITESLTNTTYSVVTVRYSIIPHFNGCDGPVFNYTVTVNPSPIVTGADSSTICNNIAQDYSIQTNVTGATFTWSRAAVPGISNPAVSNQTSSTITETLVNTVTYPVKVTYLITPSLNGCSGTTFKYSVTVNPTSMVTSVTNATVCNNMAQNYTILSNVAGTTYTWSRTAATGISNTAVTNQQGSTITEVLTNTTAGPVTVTYLIYPTANGCAGVSPFTYSVVVNPTTKVTSVANDSICNNTSQHYVLKADVPGTTFSWSRPAVTGIANGPVINQNTNNITESLNNTTTAPIVVNYQIIPSYNGCVSQSFNYAVTVYPTARISNPPATARICNNTAQNTTILADVPGATFIWSRAAVAGISNSSVTNQLGTVITEALNNTTNAPIAVTYLITPTANNCEGATWTYTLTVDPTPPTPTIISNSPVCLASTLNLSASDVPNASYSWTGPNNFTSTLQNPSIQNITLAAEGDYQVVAIVNGCYSEPAKGQVNISNLSSISNAGPNQVVCGNNALVTLNGTVTGGSVTGLWTTAGSGIFSDTTSPATTYIPSASDIAAGSVTLTLTSTNNGVCTPSVSNVKVIITPIPKADAGPDADVCDGSSAKLTAAITVAGGGKWTSSGTGTFSPSSTSLNAQYIPSAADRTAGRVKLMLTTTNNGNCFATSDTMNIRIVPLPVVKAGGEKDVMAGTKFMLMPSVAGNNLRFLWTPNVNMDNNTAKNPIITALTDLVYTITVTGEAGCQAQDKMAVRILKPFDVPNTFTPNGDGVNDTWLIPNLEKYPNCKVLIFNRYGQGVFESIGYTKPWDGLSNGKEVPFGTYYYIIDTGIGNPQMKGYVTVIR